MGWQKTGSGTKRIAGWSDHRIAPPRDRGIPYLKLSLPAGENKRELLSLRHPDALLSQIALSFPASLRQPNLHGQALWPLKPSPPAVIFNWRTVHATVVHCHR
jgi:hypothetical protein